MTIPTVTVDETGIHAPDFATVLQAVQDTFRSIYGADIYLGADSQDGQLSTVLAQAISDANAAAVATYNAFSPVTAQGTGLSSIVKLNGIRRNSASYSTVDVTMTGTANTVIMNGIVADDLNQQWLLPASVTIGGLGSVTVTATARELGELTAGIGTVTEIVTPTRGWQAVTNPTAAVPGDAIETDAALRVRQAESVAIVSLSLFDGLVAAVANLSGVTEVQGYENDTNSTDGNGLPPHSVALVVLGGDAEEIAATIADKKNPGTATYGTTSETVVNASGAPLTVNFYRPTDVPITVQLTLTKLAGYVSTTQAVIKQALADYVNGLAIGAPESGSVQWSKLFSAANDTAFGATYNVTDIQLQRDSDPLAAADVDIAFNENATLDISDVSIIET